MRVALIASPYIPVPPPKYGGTELVIDYLIKGLRELGHKPILFGTGDSDVDCEVVSIVKNAIGFPKTTKEAKRFQQELQHYSELTEKILAKHLNHVDIIHSHGFDLSPFRDFPNVTTIHGKIDLVELDYYIRHRDLPYVSISKNQQGAFPDLKYVGVVYNGEDPDQFPYVEKSQDYVCFLGRFDDEKNPHLAMELAINMGFKVKIAGKVDFQGEHYFTEKVEPLLSHPLVEYLGELDFAGKVELLSNAKCNLHPTNFREPFGLSVLEAAYCGTPTLAIARGSMPELIEEGRTGMLVEDFVEGYHQIQQCFEMDRRYISQRARLLFNYRTMTREYIKVYQKVLNLSSKLKKNQGHTLFAM